MEIKFQHIEYFFFYLLIACSFFFLPLQPISMVGLLLVSLIGFFKERRKIKVPSLWSPPVWLGLFYLLHLVGLAFTQNVEYGLTNVFLKIPFLLFPITFLLSNVKHEKFIPTIFVFGVASALVCLLLALYKFLFEGENVLLSEDQFTIFMHRGYQALYWVVALLFGGHLLKKVSSVAFQRLIYFGILLLVSSIILSFSKFGILFLLLIGVGYISRVIWKERNFKKALVILSGIVVLTLTIDTISLKPRARMIAMVEDVFSKNNEAVNGSNQVRIDMWSASMEIIAKKPVLGVGTGDINDELRKVNQEKNKSYLAKSYFNAHNQFLNAALGFGIIGLGVLIVFFWTLIRGLFPFSKSFSLVIFASIFFGLTESSFETQAGVIFQTFLFLLLWKIAFTQSETAFKS